jgi:hypothetical protein
MEESDEIQGCPICGDVERCKHFLAFDDGFEEFADGEPARLAEMLADINDEDDQAAIGTAPTPFGELFMAAYSDENGFANEGYWTDFSGVIAQEFEGDWGDGEIAYYHPDGPMFTMRIRQEAQAGIEWLEDNLPSLVDEGDDDEDDDLDDDLDEDDDDATDNV